MARHADAQYDYWPRPLAHRQRPGALPAARGWLAAALGEGMSAGRGLSDKRPAGGCGKPGGVLGNTHPAYRPAAPARLAGLGPGAAALAGLAVGRRVMHTPLSILTSSVILHIKCTEWRLNDPTAHDQAGLGPAGGGGRPAGGLPGLDLAGPAPAAGQPPDRW